MVRPFALPGLVLALALGAGLAAGCAGAPGAASGGGLRATVLAGGTTGDADGVGAAAQFNQPFGLAYDGRSSLYVTDLGNSLIRKLTPAGSVTTLARDKNGYIDPCGASVRLAHPFGVTVNHNGVYLTDTDLSQILIITATDSVLMKVTGENAGFADGSLAAARFDHPRGITSDAAGDLYVADTNNHRIRMLTTGGQVVTIAGSGTPGSADGPGASAQFDRPYGVALDGAGNLYVGDEYNDRVRKIAHDGTVSTLAGSTRGDADGAGTAAKFDHPEGVAVDAGGNVYVADSGNALVRRIDPTGAVTTLHPTLDGKPLTFGQVEDVAVGPNGSLYVSDAVGDRIYVLGP